MSQAAPGGGASLPAAASTSVAAASSHQRRSLAIQSQLPPLPPQPPGAVATPQPRTLRLADDASERLAARLRNARMDSVRAMQDRMLARVEGQLAALRHTAASATATAGPVGSGAGAAGANVAMRVRGAGAEVRGAPPAHQPASALTPLPPPAVAARRFAFPSAQLAHQQQQQQQRGFTPLPSFFAPYSSAPGSAPGGSPYLPCCHTCGVAHTSQSSEGERVKSALARCSGCRAVYYCSGRCQQDDWSHHKWLCRHVRTLDTHKLPFLKISSTIPGNFHRPLISTEPTPPAAHNSDSATPPTTAAPPVAPPLPSSSSPQQPVADATNLAASTPTPPATNDAIADAAQNEPAPAADPPRVRSKRARRSQSGTAAASSTTAAAAAALSVFDFPSASPASTAATADSPTTLVPDNATSDAQPQTEDACEDSDDEAELDPLQGSTAPRRGKRQKREHEAATSNPAQSALPHIPPPPAAAMPAIAAVISSNGDGAAPVPLALQPLVLPSDLSPDAYASISPSFLLSCATDESSLLAAYGPRPRKGQVCLLFYQARASTGAIVAKNRGVWFNSSQSSSAAASGHSSAPASHLSTQSLAWLAEVDGSTPLQLTLGIGDVIQCWDRCVETMFKGETAVIVARDEERQVFVYELQLVDFW